MIHFITWSWTHFRNSSNISPDYYYWMASNSIPMNCMWVTTATLSIIFELIVDFQWNWTNLCALVLPTESPWQQNNHSPNKRADLSAFHPGAIYTLNTNQMDSYSILVSKDYNNNNNNSNTVIWGSVLRGIRKLAETKRDTVQRSGESAG